MKSFISALAGSDHPEGIASEVCVVGSGPAGALVACELVQAGADVALFESGGTLVPNVDESINSIAIDGKQGSSFRRSSILGGSSNVWGGLVGVMDRHDFTRSGGWPVDYDEFTNYYQRACGIIGVRWEALLEKQPKLLAPTVQYKLFQASDPPFSMFEYLKKFVSADHPGRLRVFVNATVQTIKVDANGTVYGLDIADRSKRITTIAGTHFVLAAGGLETPRLLLLSNDRQSKGIGNAYDLVGRYLSTHPRCDIGTIAFARELRRSPTAEPFLSRSGAPMAIGLSEDHLKSSGGLNHQLQLLPLWYSRAGNLLDWAQRKSLDANGYMATRGNEPAPRVRRAMLRTAARLSVDVPRRASAVAHFDQYPNAENRIALSPQRDRHGLQKVDIRWHLSNEDIVSISGFLAHLKNHLVEHRAVKLDERAFDKIRAGSFIGLHSHHLGTTRMSRDEKSGVVNEHGRVHNTHNLYICGPSVFPTFGCANPFLTVAALALRLADHLIVEMGLRVQV